jgi:serine/threonine-protein kinase haspin
LPLALAYLNIPPMLGTRTKQVSSYGRRKRRIINDRHDLFDVEDTKISRPSGPKEFDQTYAYVTVTPPSRRGHSTANKVEVTPPPPSTTSPPMPSHNRSKNRRENDQVSSSLKHFYSSSSSRRPLNSHPVNVSGRSSLSRPKKKKRLSGSSGALLPQSPAIDVDILVLDQTGRRISQERRVSKTNVQVNQRSALHPGSATHQHPSVIVVNDDDSPSPQLKRRVKRWPKVMNSSDEEDVAETPLRSVTCLNVCKHRINGDGGNQSETTNHLKPQIPRASPSPATNSKAHFWVEIPSPRLPARSQSQGLTVYDLPAHPPRGKDRPLTPIRLKGLTFSRLPPTPSTIADLDLSLDLANLTLSSTPVENDAVHDQPPHLIPLLDECGQDAPIEFSSFIEAFPVHPIVRSSYPGRAEFQKIGEASYSEVFGIGDVVLKIIPIHNEEFLDEIDAETPAPSDAKDILKEIVVTRALGEMCNGFVNLLKTYVVRGKYPSLLLDLWDEYDQTKGSESVRPGAIPRVSTTQT